MNGMVASAVHASIHEASSGQLVAERERLEAIWYDRTTAEDVLIELCAERIDIEEKLAAAFAEKDPVRAVGEVILAVRRDLAARYAKAIGDDFPPYRRAQS